MSGHGHHHSLHLPPAHRPGRLRWPSTATPSASRSATTSATRGCAGSPSVPPTSPTPPSCCTRRPPTPGITDDERRTILELIAKGSYIGVNLATDDLDETFEKLEASGAEVVQEPTDQPYGVRDCAFRDPAGNLVRINELRLSSRDARTPATDETRKADTLAMLATPAIDVWVATASALGAPYLVPVSLAWVDERVGDRGRRHLGRRRAT